jgi:hypothetical protein
VYLLSNSLYEFSDTQPVEVSMPVDINPAVFVPPCTFYFMTILRYVSLFFVLVVVIRPTEGGGTPFLIMLGILALLIVGDVYGSEAIPNLFVIFLMRVMAVVIPAIMTGTGTDKTTRQFMGVVAFLGAPSIAIMLFTPFLDPAVGYNCPG